MITLQFKSDDFMVVYFPLNSPGVFATILFLSFLFTKDLN